MSWLLAHDFRLDESTIFDSTGDILPDGLASNMKTMEGGSLGKAWRTSSLTNTFANFEFTSEIVPAVLFIAGSSARSTATVTFRGSDSGLIKSDVDFPATYNAAANLWIAIPSGERLRDRWRVAITDTGNPEGELRTGFFGIATDVLEINDCYRPSKSWQPVPGDTRHPNPRGGVMVSRQRMWTRLAIPFRLMQWDLSDSEEIRDAMHAIHSVDPILVVLDPTDLATAGHVFFGTLSRDAAFLGTSGRFQNGEIILDSVEN